MLACIVKCEGCHHTLFFACRLETRIVFYFIYACACLYVQYLICTMMYFYFHTYFFCITYIYIYIFALHIYIYIFFFSNFYFWVLCSIFLFGHTCRNDQLVNSISYVKKIWLRMSIANSWWCPSCWHYPDWMKVKSLFFTSSSLVIVQKEVGTSSIFIGFYWIGFTLVIRSGLLVFYHQ